MTIGLRTSLRPIAALATLAMLSACASHPFVSWEEPIRPSSEPIPLASAFVYADRARQGYEQALIAEVQRRMQLSNGLIVLGAATLGLAAANYDRGQVLGAALVGGTAYTLGTWNASDPREQVYLEGAKAMICAKDAMLPLSAGAAQVSAFRQHVNALGQQIRQVNANLGTLEALLPASGADGDLVEAARSEATAARALLQTARQAQGAGDLLQTQRGHAGEKLVSAIQSIRNLVDNALKKTLPNLGALPDVIRGLAKQASIFVPGAGDVLAGGLAAVTRPAAGAEGIPEARGAEVLPKAVTSENAALRNALADLKRSNLQLASDMSRVNAEVEAVNAARPLAALKSCGVEADTDIQVSPSQVRLTEKDTGTRRIRVSGGKMPYVARLLDTPAAIEVHSPFTGDSTVEIVGTDKTVAGTIYTVYIEDAAGNSKTVSVIIAAKAAAGDNSNRGAADAAVASTSRAKEDITAMQQSVCAPVTGVFDSATRLAVQVFEAESGSGTPDGDIDAAQFAQLKKETSDGKKCAKDRANYYEKSLSAEEIKAVRKLLKLPEAGGQIDKAMRDAIVREPVPADFGKDERARIGLKAKEAGQLSSAFRIHLVGRK